MEPTDNKEGVTLEAVTEVVVGDCANGDKLVMCWEVVEDGEVLTRAEEPDGGLREEPGTDEDEEGWRRAMCGGVEMGAGEGRAERAGGVLGGFLGMVDEVSDSCGEKVCFDTTFECPGG